VGLFGKSCPLEISYIKIYGIHSPRKWKKDDCLVCEFFQDSKCHYDSGSSRQQVFTNRGRPALVKKSTMDRPAEARKKSETESVNKAGFSAAELQEYWAVSKEYDELWTESSEEDRREILDRLDQWKVNLEKGLSPFQANEEVKEWLRKRAEFKGG
jgi:hypothetical protein